MLDAGEDFPLLDTRGDESYDLWYVRGAEQFESGTDDSLTDERNAELEFGDSEAEEGARMQYQSLHRTLLVEPDDVVVLPGHVDVTSGGEFEHGQSGEPVRSTVGEARTTFDPLLDEDDFVERLTGDHEKPPNYERVFEINRGAESVSMQEAAELEVGPNRCSA